jgi:hypothetical protein
VNGDVHGDIIINGDGTVDIPGGNGDEHDDITGYIHVDGITHYHADGSSDFEEADLLLHVVDMHWSIAEVLDKPDDDDTYAGYESCIVDVGVFEIL